MGQLHYHAGMVWSVNQLESVPVNSYNDCKELDKRKFLLVHLQHQRTSGFFYIVMEQWIFWEMVVGDSDRNTWNFWKCSWKWSCALHTCHWMVYNMHRYMLRLWKKPKNGQLLPIQNQEQFLKLCEMMFRDCQMFLKLMWG